MPIVVASSNVFCRELSSYVLSEAGYTIYEVSTTAELLRCLDHIRPNLVVLDTRLAETSCHDLISHIRLRDSIPILSMVRAVSRVESSEQVTCYGDAVLTWPYQTEDLLAHVRALCVLPMERNVGADIPAHRKN